MKIRQVLFSVEAEAELLQIYDWIADETAPDVALAYVVRVQEFCQRLEIGSERGRSRDDIRPGLRIIGFERRITIAFVVDPERVVILRLFYAGRDWENLLARGRAERERREPPRDRRRLSGSSHADSFCSAKIAYLTVSGARPP